MPLLFAVSPSGLLVPIRVTDADRVMVDAEPPTSTGDPVHVDADGDVYVRPTDWYNGADKVLVDASGRQYVIPYGWLSQGSSLSVDASGRANVISHGLVGGEAHREAMRLGYSGAVGISVSNTNLSAGVNNLDASAVPSGRVYVITNVSMEYWGTPPSQLSLRIVRGGVTYVIYAEYSIAHGRNYTRVVNLVMAPGDVLRMTIVGATAGDDAYLYAVGYYTDISQ